MAYLLMLTACSMRSSRGRGSVMTCSQRDSSHPFVRHVTLTKEQPDAAAYWVRLPTRPT
jgi:hypothetical protein